MSAIDKINNEINYINDQYANLRRLIINFEVNYGDVEIERGSRYGILIIKFRGGLTELGEILDEESIVWKELTPTQYQVTLF